MEKGVRFIGNGQARESDIWTKSPMFHFCHSVK